MWLPGFDFFHLLMNKQKNAHTYTHKKKKNQQQQKLEKKQTHTAQVKNVTTSISFLWSFTDEKKNSTKRKCD